MPSSSDRGDQGRPTLRRSWWARHAGLITSAVVAVAVLGPMLFTRGFWLYYDMVFVPHLPLSSLTLGTAGQVPRAVPNDVVVALVDLVLPGDITQKLVLLGFFLAVGAGVDRWRAGVVVRVATSVALLWNPWVAERLAIGHWGYLWGYAACVWAFLAVDALRRGCPARRLVIVALVVSAASGSTGAVLVAISLAVGALAVVLTPGVGRIRLRPTLVTTLAWLGLNAAWWWPFLTAAPSGTADAAGVEAFAARGDGVGPAWLSLLGGGGIWHSPSWFAERGSLLVAVASALVCVLGVVVATRGFGRAPVLTIGLTGLILAGASTVPGVSDLMTAIVLHVPGGGLLRDGQKFVALWVVPAAFGWGMLAQAVTRRGRGSVLAPVALVAGVLVPLALLPGLAWARSGQWQAVEYPSSWQGVRDDVARADAGRGGATLVLPWSTYRRYAWNGERTVLDPWNRLLTGRVVTDDSLPVRDGAGVRTVAGEDRDAVTVGSALAHGSADELRSALREAHVTAVLVQVDQPDAAAAVRLVRDVGAEPVRTGSSVLRVDGTTGLGAPPWWRGIGLAASALTAVVVLTAGLRSGGADARRRAMPTNASVRDSAAGAARSG